MSILIVEDNPVNARLLVLMLKAQGYHTVVASNGKEALVTAANTPDIQLIITDYMMPEMDGMEFILKVRTLPAFSRVPIIVASAHGDHETVKRVQGLRCDGFLVKPIDKKQLIKRVEQLLESQPLVLLGQHNVMAKLEIEPAEYQELVQAFEAQLAATIPLVLLEQGDSEEPISENLGRLLKELAESASTLGADKFSLLYSKCTRHGRPPRSQCQALLNALQELELSLLALIKPPSNAEPATTPLL